MPILLLRFSNVFVQIMLFSLFFCGALVNAKNAFADQTAQAIKKEIQNTLSFHETLYAKQFDISWVWDGELIVEPVDSYYAVTLPDLKILNQKTQEEIHIGMIAMNIVPVKQQEDVPEMWRVSVALPTPMFVYHKDKIIGKLDMDKQNIAVAWIPQWRQAIDAQIEFHFIKLEDYKSGSGFFVEHLGLERNYDPSSLKQGRQLWSGSDIFSIENAEVFYQESKEPFARLGKIRTESRTQNIDLKKISEVQESLRDLSSWTVENQSHFGLMSLFDIIMQQDGLYQSQQINFYGDDLFFFDRQTKKTVEVKRLEGQSKYQIEPERQYKTKIWLSDIVSSTRGEKGEQQMSAYAPIKVFIDATLSHLPTFQEIRNLIHQVEKPKEGNSKTLTGQSLYQYIPSVLELLDKKGTTLDIEKIDIATAITSFDLSGKMTFNKDAKWGIESVWVILMRGFEKVAQLLSSDPEQKKMMGNSAILLPMIQSLGQIDQPSEDVEAVRKYHIEVKADGQILLNGTNFSPLLSAIQPKAK